MTILSNDGSPSHTISEALRCMAYSSSKPSVSPIRNTDGADARRPQWRSLTPRADTVGDDDPEEYAQGLPISFSIGSSRRMISPS
jgi:hypothetical protein